MSNPYYDIKELAISHSSRALFNSCARKLEFRKFYKHNGNRDSAFAADVGTALHAGFQDYLVHGDREKAIFEMMIHYPVELYWQSSGNKARSLEACYAALTALMNSDFAREYDLIEILCLDGQTRPAVEVAFEIAFQDFSLNGDFNEDGTPEIPVRFIGYIDAIFSHRRTKKMMTSDLKTHRITAHDLEPKYFFDEQCVPYGLALEHALGHSVDEFTINYLSQYVDVMNPQLTPYTITKTKDMVSDWAQGMFYDLSQMRHFYESGWFPRSTTGDTCFAYQKPCQFYEVCHLRDHEKLKQIFTPNGSGIIMPERIGRDEEWNPWIRVPLAFH